MYSRLTQIFQAGILDFLKRSDLPSTKICPLDLQSKDRKLRNSDLIMTYMVMVAGSATAVAVFGAEVSYSTLLLCIKVESVLEHVVFFIKLFDFPLSYN